MTDHGPNRSPRSTPSQSKPLANVGDRLRQWFSRERWSAFAERFGWSKLRRTPGLGWFVFIAAIALLIQGVGLANLIAVNDAKQTWNAAAGQRQSLLDEIASLQQEQFDAKQELHKTKGLIDAESARLAEVQAALKLNQELRDQAQREQAAAESNTLRQQELNDTLAAKITDLNAKKEAVVAAVSQLEGDRARLAAEVDSSKKLLEDHRAEVTRALAHAKELDAQAAASVEAIRASREGYVKAQTDLDEANRAHAKAAAERDAAQVALAALQEQSKNLESNIVILTQQLADQQAAIAASKKATDEATAAREKAQAELDALLTRLDKVTKQLAEKQGALAAEESLLQSAQTRHDAIKSRVAGLQAELKPLEEQRLVIDADINGKKKEIQTLQERLQSLRMDLKTLLESAPKVAPPTPPSPASSKQPEAPSQDNLLDDAAKAPAK